MKLNIQSAHRYFLLGVRRGLLGLVLMAGQTPVFAVESNDASELAQCRALSQLPDDIHNCMDNFLDALDVHMAAYEAEVLEQLGGLDSVPGKAFSVSQQSFGAYRRDNCLWYQAFSQPSVEAEQIAKSCLIDMSRVRLSELMLLLDEKQSQGQEFQGYYLYGDDRNTLVLCGSDERYWVQGNQAELARLQQFYLSNTNIDNSLLFVAVTGNIDDNPESESYPGHDGLFNLTRVSEARLLAEEDCPVGKELGQQAEQKLQDNTSQNTDDLWLEAKQTGTDIIDKSVTGAVTGAALDPPPLPSPPIEPEAPSLPEQPELNTVEVESDSAVEPMPLADQSDVNSTPAQQETEPAIVTESAQAEAEIQPVPQPTATAAETGQNAIDQSATIASNNATQEQEQSDETDAPSTDESLPEEALTAYFGAWKVDCERNEVRNLCVVSAHLEGQNLPELLQPNLELTRRSSGRTVIDLTFPGQEIASVDNIYWKIDSIDLGVLTGSRLQIGDAAAVQQLRQRTQIQVLVLPQLIAGYELNVTVEDATTQRSVYVGTLIGLTRALLFADEFISPAGQ